MNSASSSSTATSGARLTPAGEEFVVGARRIIDVFHRLSG